MSDALDSAMNEILDSRAPGGLCVGWIVSIGADGCPLVDFPGNPSAPVDARHVLTGLPAGFTVEAAPSVLLAFESGDPGRPIIMGFLHDSLAQPVPERTETILRERDWSVRLDKRRVVFDAEEEVVLRCGKSSVTLRKDGRIVLKGVEIVSRALETNKIKGANVMIN
jgi:hypothetical protein